MDAPPQEECLFREFSRMGRTNHQWDRLGIGFGCRRTQWRPIARLFKNTQITLETSGCGQSAVYVMLAEENASRQE